MSQPSPLLAKRQAGTAMVEFALSMGLLCVSLVAVIELARFMLLFNTAAEAARLAGRLASVCAQDTAQQARVRAKVQYFLEASGQIRVGQRSDWLLLSYSPVGCSASNCTLVEARLAGLQAPLMIPLWSFSVPLPAYRSAQVREAMRNVVAGDTNTAC